MNGTTLTGILLALLVLFAPAQAADKISKESLDSHGRADKLNREADEMDQRAEQLIAGKNQ